jgi:hypothetical protein
MALEESSLIGIVTQDRLARRVQALLEREGDAGRCGRLGLSTWRGCRRGRWLDVKTCLRPTGSAKSPFVFPGRIATTPLHGLSAGAGRHPRERAAQFLALPLPPGVSSESPIRAHVRAVRSYSIGWSGQQAMPRL